MGVQAKKEGILRFFGMILVLIGIILSIACDILILNDFLLILLYLLALIPWILIVVLLKIESELIEDRVVPFITFAVSISTVIIVIGLIYKIAEIRSVTFVFLCVSIIALLIGWHFVISLYKKEKYVFFTGIVVYLVLTIIFRVLYGNLLGVLSFVIVLIGTVLVLIIEYLMRKKGLLNYI